MNDRHTGVVKWFSNKLGYGFLEVESVNSDVLVHQDTIKMKGYRTLLTEQKVTFKLSKTSKGYHAIDVELIN